MQFTTYILFSDKLKKYYVGYTDNIEKRLDEHNRGKSKFTSKGIPWRLIQTYELISKRDAYNLEMKIKKRGCKRFLEDYKQSLVL